MAVQLPALAHVALTVNDLSVSVPWYERLLGTKPVLDEDTDAGFHHTVYALPGGTLLGLHEHPSNRAGDGFDERRPGMDHLAFAVGGRAELESWQSRLDDLQIAHGGIVDAHYGSGLSFRDPDNIALEIFAPPTAD